MKIPDRDYRLAVRNPIFRRFLFEVSMEEEEENSYYDGMLDTLADHTCGTFPRIMGDHPQDNVNDILEDELHKWCVENEVASVIRQIRRDAALTGIGIAIPYKKLNTENPISLGFKAIQRCQLSSPVGASVDDRIYDGIEYDKNWDIKAIHVADGSETKEYKAKDIIIWCKRSKGGMPVGVPECGPALCLYPSVRRVMEAIVRGEEFVQSIPMAIELDPLIYGKDAVEGTPSGKFKYEPGMIPTLPPGTKLAGLNVGARASERTEFIELVIGAAARCIQMPKSLALGDSSGSNMSVASYDVQPWENKVKIDRTDFEIVPRKIYKQWFAMAELNESHPNLPASVRSQIRNFNYTVNYDYVFKHPDPNKNAAARATDLISGAKTLFKLYTDECRNPRRELQREARLLGIEYSQLIAIKLAAQTPQALQIIGMINEANQDTERSNTDDTTSDQDQLQTGNSSRRR